ncbi:hypothetical protein [Yoonia sp.]|uniref:hypothetical protein n=1 Tax=Yoonia sp. TaxID=2212373 RepID=UPI00391C3CAE
MIRVIWVMFYAFVAACGGGGGGANYGGDPVIPPPPPPDLRLARLDEYREQKIRVLGDAVSGVTGMAVMTADLPTQGAAAFSGFATLRVEGAQPLILSGDARLDVDFGAGQVSGGMDRFFGTGPGGGVADYDGTISITGGQVQHDLRLHYAGALTGAGQQLALSGDLEGRFLADPLRAVTAADLAARVVQNGQIRDGTLVIVVETEGVVTPQPP